LPLESCFEGQHRLPSRLGPPFEIRRISVEPGNRASFRQLDQARVGSESGLSEFIGRSTDGAGQGVAARRQDVERDTVTRNLPGSATESRSDGVEYGSSQANETLVPVALAGRHEDAATGLRR